ncbi:MAG: hypothetical protein JW966_03185 [Anaerolineae bacterium]|nr:hypothetical protein [Anaerolineae bacterium]
MRSLVDRIKYRIAVPIVKYIRWEWAIRQWHAAGRTGAPPHLFKQRVVKQYARQFGLKTLVETGTHLGEMVNATKRTFDRIYTIELSEDRCREASQRFARFPHITVIQGSSDVMLPGVLAEISTPCLFWLDAHYSGGITVRGDKDTPIVEELRTILVHPVGDHVILIDDAREFVGKNDYPAIAELEALIHSVRPEFTLDARDDIIRIHKAGQPAAK